MMRLGRSEDRAWGARVEHLLVHRAAGEHHAAQQGLDVVQLRVAGSALQRLLHAHLQVQRLRLASAAAGTRLTP